MLYTETLCLLQEYLPLDECVAACAGCWGATCGILLTKVVDDISLKTLSAIVEIPLYAQLLGTVLGALDGCVTKHSVDGDGNNAVTLAFEMLCRCGAVYATAETQ
jgi:hypothetical protein